MAELVRCPECSLSLSVGPELLGRKGRCRGCGHRFIITPSGEQPGSGADAGPAPPPSNEPAPPSRGARRTASGSDRRPSRGSALDDTLPDRLGRFEIRARLGAGAFGTVYRAFDPVLDREVALKVPQAGTLQTPKSAQRFLREAKAAAQLHHPHIVPVFDAGVDGSRHYIASAFIAGRTLADAVDEGKLPSRVAGGVTLALAEALHYAHGLGVVHRDVKPSNVMLDAQGRAYLMDFGLARLSLTEEKLTHDGAVLGTPAYMAPEQASGRTGEVGPASDQYSLGILLYELLCGETPFSGPPEIVLFNAIHQPPRPPRTIVPDLPIDLETICLKAVAKTPPERYPDCQSLADDLRHWLEGEPILARRLGPVERLVRWGRRNPVVAGLIAAVALTLAGGAVVSTSFAIQAAHQRTQAVAFALQADARKAEAERQKGVAEGYAAEARRQADELEDQLYVSLVGRAYGEWEAAQLVNTERHLAEAPPRRRGWEWAFVERLCHLDRLTYRGHDDQVRCVAFSPDGRRIASGTGNFVWDVADTGRLAVWDAETGRTAFDRRGLVGGVQGVAFSPDGGTIAAVSGFRGPTDNEGALTLFDPDGNPRVRRSFSGTNLLCVAYSPDGRRLAVGSGLFNIFGAGKQECLLLDATTGSTVATLPGHPGGVSSVAFHPDGSRLAVASSGVVEVWDVAARKVVRAFKGHRSFVYAVAFSPDGRRLAAGGWGDVTRVWDTESEDRLVIVPARTVRALAYSPDGARLATGSEDRLVQVWDTATGEAAATFRGHQGAVTGLAYDSGGGRLATTSRDGTVKLWDARVEQPITLRHDPRAIGYHWITTSVMSDDGRLAVTAGRDGVVRTWDGTTGRAIRTLEPTSAVPAGEYWCGALRPDGGELAAGHNSGTILRWDPRTGRDLPPMRGHAGPIYQVAYSPDGRRLASSGEDGTIRLWRTDTGDAERTIAAHSYPVHGLAFGPGGAWLVSSAGLFGWEGLDPTAGEASAWDATTGERLWARSFPKALVQRVAVTPDGRVVAVAFRDGSLRFLDAKGRDVRTIAAHPGQINALAVSPDGRRLITGAEDGVRFWDPATGRETFAVPGRSPLNLSFGDGGRKLLLGFMDAHAEVWDSTPVEPAPGPAPAR